MITLALVQKCASKSAHSRFWLPLENQIEAIIKTPSSITFRRTWLEHTMQVSGAIKMNGQSCPRKWAKMLVPEKDPELDAINSKAIEVNSWLKGRKQPSVQNIKRSGHVLFASLKLNLKQFAVENDLWLFSWMVTLWLERHFSEVAAELKGDPREIRTYYRRFFHYSNSLALAQA